MTSSILILLTIATLGWHEALCQTVPHITDDPVCRPHILEQCRNLNYNTTLPNLRGQTIPSVIEEEFLQFEILFRYNCSNALLILLCSIYAPFCGITSANSTPVVLQPCRNICNHVYDGCIGVFNEFQYQWPKILTCENFPQRDEDLCFGPPNPSTIPYPTLVSPNVTIPLPTTPDTTTSSPTTDSPNATIPLSDANTSSPTTDSPNATIPLSDANTSSPTTDTNPGAIMGGSMGGIVLLLMIIVFFIIVILRQRRCPKTEVSHVYEEIYFNAAKLNTGVTIKHRPSYDVAKDETADSFIKIDTNPSYGVSVGEGRVTAFSTTATADSDTQSSQQHDYDNVHDSSQLHHNTATNTSSDDNVQIHATVDKKHKTEETYSSYLFSVAKSDKLTDEGEYGIINQPQCNDPNFDTTVDHSHTTESPVIASSTKLADEGKYGIIDQPQCNDPNTVDQSHATKPCLPLIARFTDESEYGVINQPQSNFDITVDQSHTTESPVIAKLTDEDKYGIINQPQCNDPNFDITGDQSPTTKSCLPLIANNADEGEYGIINQPQCNDPNFDITGDQSPTTKSCLPLIANNADEGEYGIINQPQCNDPNFDITGDQSPTTKSFIANNADEGEYGVINQPQCNDLI